MESSNRKLSGFRWSSVKRSANKTVDLPRETSRFLHFWSRLSSRPGAGALVVVVVVVYGVLLTLNGFPSKWEAGFQTGVGAITLIMLFAIQHTQSRQQTATQLKLDELIRATPQADSLLVKIEKAENDELDEREKALIAQHESLREKSADRDRVDLVPQT